MAVPIPPMLKYSVVYNSLNSWPILIKFASKCMVYEALYFAVQYALRLHSPLSMAVRILGVKIVFNLYHSLGKFSKWHIDDIFLVFPRKQILTFHANCLQTICIKCQILFSGKNKKISSVCHLLKIFLIVLSIKSSSSVWSARHWPGFIVDCYFCFSVF